MIDSQLQGPVGANGPAIRLEKGRLYAARLTTSGYTTAIATSNAPAGDVVGPSVAEYSSHGIEIVGDWSPKTGLLFQPPHEC